MFRKFKNVKKQLPYSFLIYTLSEEIQEDQGNGQGCDDFRLGVITYGGRKVQSQILWSDSVSCSGWWVQDAHFLSLAYTYRHTTFILRVQYMFFFVEVPVW